MISLIRKFRVYSYMSTRSAHRKLIERYKQNREVSKEDDQDEYKAQRMVSNYDGKHMNTTGRVEHGFLLDL